MGAVCFAEDDDHQMRYGHGEPGMYGEPGYPYPTGMPPRNGMGPAGGKRYLSEEEFLYQQRRMPDTRQQPRDGGYDTGRDPYHTRPYQHEHGVRDTFGGRGLRPKTREFGSPPSEDSFAVHNTRHQQDHFQNYEQDVQTAFGGRGLRVVPREFGAPHADESHGGAPSATYPQHYVSPQDGYRDAGGYGQPRQESFDGYDDSQDRVQAPRLYENDGHGPGLPRKKSLSERVQEYKKRKNTEDAHLGLNELRGVIRPSKSADRPDTGSRSQDRELLERKKSLQERVAEFKDKRKHSQSVDSESRRRKSSRGRENRRNPDDRERKSSRGRKKSEGKSRKHYSKRENSEPMSKAKSRAELTTQDIVRKLSQRSQNREDYGGSNQQPYESHRQPHRRRSQTNRNQSWVIHE